MFSGKFVISETIESKNGVCFINADLSNLDRHLKNEDVFQEITCILKDYEADSKRDENYEDKAIVYYMKDLNKFYSVLSVKETNENKDIYSFYRNEDLDMITSKLNNIIRK